MNTLEVILCVCDLLQRGHVQQADLDLRRHLAGMSRNEPEYAVMDKAAQLIWPEDKPKDALALLQDYMENLNVEGRNGTRT